MRQNRRKTLSNAATVGMAAVLGLGGTGCGQMFGGDRYRAPDALRGAGNGPKVSVHLTKPIVTEGAGVAAEFQITRDHGGPRENLLVHYRVGGSAPASQFAQALDGQVIIPAGRRSVTLYATPIDDGQANPARTLTIALTTPPDCNYRLDEINQATALVLDGDGGQTKYHDLIVGPGQAFTRVSQAVAASTDGDFIDILSGHDYLNDTASIHHNNVTLRGIGDGLARLISDTHHIVPNGMGLIVQRQHRSDLVVENLDLEGARNEHKASNGCGIRTFGPNLTVTNCRFYNDEDGILGGAGDMLIQYSEFCHDSTDSQSHNLYINERTQTLTFQYNYTHDGGIVGKEDSNVGHLFKSRAKINRVLYNTFDSGQSYASYELSTPNGGQDTIVGNLIVQGHDSGNPVIVDYASESKPAAGDFLSLASNTIVNWMTPREAIVSADHIKGETPQVIFVRAEHLPAAFDVTLENNIFAGWGDVYDLQGATNTPRMNKGNLVCPDIDKAGFLNAANGNYHLTSTSGAIGIGIVTAITEPPGDARQQWLWRLTMAESALLTPTKEPIQPEAWQARIPGSEKDAGAFGFPVVEVRPKAASGR